MVAGIDEFNGFADHAVRQVLRHCCSSARWVDALVAGRPYPSLEALLAGSDSAVAAMGEADLREALAGHPRLGDRSAAGAAGEEQAGVRAAGTDVLQELAEGNALYERRFGHVYLARAAGRSAGGLLAFLRARLGNDRETEWRVVAEELAAVNRIRLRRLIGGAA